MQNSETNSGYDPEWEYDEPKLGDIFKLEAKRDAKYYLKVTNWKSYSPTPFLKVGETLTYIGEGFCDTTVVPLYGFYASPGGKFYLTKRHFAEYSAISGWHSNAYWFLRKMT